jgi:hypothetical protein
MTAGPEITIRIDFFRDLPETFDLENPPAAKDYAGSAWIKGVRPLQVPRVGEYVHGLHDVDPAPVAVVTGVEHRIAGVGGETEPSMIVAISAPFPGEVGVKSLEAEGWTWREASSEIPGAAAAG